MKLTYLLIDIVTMVIPLAFSFEQKFKFRQQWKYVFPSIFFVGILFIIWDSWFTQRGIWGFHDQYIIGIRIAYLPIEEWLFFLSVPYACIFIYALLIKYIKQNALPYRIVGWVTLALVLLFAGITIFNWHRLYTSFSFGFCALALLLLRVTKVSWLPHLFLAFILILLPFTLINGLLTGAFLNRVVVWYNDAQNMGIRLLTIPVEDIAYGFILFTLTVSFYEYLKKKG